MDAFLDPQLFFLTLFLGCFAGFIAGMLGVGGGLIIVPIVLYLLYHILGHVAYAQHIAIGSSFAIMVFTSFSSMLSQHKHGAVRWDIFKTLLPGIVIGTVFGSAVASYIPTQALQIIFVLFVYFVAIQTFLDAKPKATRQIPNTHYTMGIGGIIGTVSSWIGIGGGTLSVPFMMYCNVPMRQAIGTSAALGWPIAIFGAISYIISGLQISTLPTGTLGFVYLPAFVILSVCTVIFAPLGAKVGNHIAPRKLKITFACILTLTALKMTAQLMS